MLVEGGKGWSGKENLYTLELTRQPLGVECRACQHRALVPLATARRCGHDMTPIKRLPMVCRCGSREWLAVLFMSAGDDPHGWQGAPGPTF